LIPNGIDLNQFDQLAAAPIALGLFAGPIVGTVGRLVAQKGMDVFLQAAGMTAPRRTDVTFVIAGDGPLRESCAAQMTALGLTGRAQMLGERGDVPALLQHLSVFVSASRWEGLPYALLEALAARRPIVATCVLGSEELIQDGVTGLLVPPDDPESMSRAIVRLLDDPALAHRLGANGRQQVETHYNLQTMAGQVMAVYERAMSRRPPRI
jgi:glycosyltransferase involved in cell wall biosynthesis